MALITRLSRLIRADMHAVLDRLEEPDVLLRQAIREMEDALVDDRQLANAARRENGQLALRDAALAKQAAVLEEELDVCFESGKDELARRVVRRQLEAQRLRETLSSRRKSLEEDLAVVESRLADDGARLDAMRQAAEALVDDGFSYNNRSHSRAESDADSGVIRNEDVDVAWLREQRRRATS